MFFFVLLVGFKSISGYFSAGLPKPNATLFLYPGLGLAMLRRDWNISKEIAFDRSAWRLAINVPEP